MEDDYIWPYLLGAGWGTTLTVFERPKKIKKRPIGFHKSPKSIKVKSNGNRT